MVTLPRRLGAGLRYIDTAFLGESPGCPSLRSAEVDYRHFGRYESYLLNIESDRCPTAHPT
jgi:hypothetical protein